MKEIAQVLNEAFDATGIKYHDRAAALAELKADGREVTFDAEGDASVTYDGEANVPLADALKRFAYDRRDLVDGRTLPREGVGSTRPGIASKADFETPKDKAAFITANGFEAWERLPLTGATTSEVTTFEQWRKLPLAEKNRRIHADPDAVRKLTAAAPFVPGQGKIYSEALAKHVAARPNHR